MPNTIKLFKNLITLTFVVLLFIYLFKNWDEFIIVLNIPLSYLGLISLFLCCDIFLSSYRFFINLKPMNPQITYTQYLKYYLTGGLIGAFIQQGSSVYRCFSLKLKDQVPIKNYIASIFCAQWYLIVIGSLCGTILLYFLNVEESHTNNLDWIRIFFCALFLLSIVLTFAFKWLPTRPRNPFINILLILSSITIGSLALYYVFISMNITLNFIIVILLLILVKLCNITAFITGNLGVREFILGALATIVGEPLLIGVTASLIIRCVTFLLHVVLSIGMQLKNNKSCAES